MNFLSKIVDATRGVENPLVYQFVNIAENSNIEHKQICKVDTSAGPVVLTCPASPHEGFEFFIIDIIGGFKTNNCTIEFNGQLFRGDSSLVLDIPNTCIGLIFLDNSWFIKSLYTKRIRN